MVIYLHILWVDFLDYRKETLLQLATIKTPFLQKALSNVLYKNLSTFLKQKNSSQFNISFYILYKTIPYNSTSSLLTDRSAFFITLILK